MPCTPWEADRGGREWFRFEILIQKIRQESQFAQIFGCGAFGLCCIAEIVTRMQGRTTGSNPNDVSSALFLMSLGFLGCAYGRLTLRIAQVAETLADIQEHAASPEPRDNFGEADGPSGAEGRV